MKLVKQLGYTTKMNPKCVWDWSAKVEDVSYYANIDFEDQYRLRGSITCILLILGNYPVIQMCAFLLASPAENETRALRASVHQSSRCCLIAFIALIFRRTLFCIPLLKGFSVRSSNSTKEEIGHSIHITCNSDTTSLYYHHHAKIGYEIGSMVISKYTFRRYLATLNKYSYIPF